MDVAELSRLIFGRPCRLPLALWILHLEKPRFFQSEPPRELGAATALRQELERLCAAGMLEEERPDAENRVYYIRTESPLWGVVAAADEALSD